MNKGEKQLFKKLCSFKESKFDEKLLEYATPSVLGHLFFNRMHSIAYGILEKHGLLGKVNREFRNSLMSAYEQDIEKNRSFFSCVRYLNEILSECNFKYAMLKGAFLCRYYPSGYRTSNDIDILVSPNDVTKIGNILIEHGFKQGSIRNGEFVPATRKEIIESKMLYGETVPFIKTVGFKNMKYLEVDINFSLDYKSGDTRVLEKLLKKSHKRDVYGLEISTLDNNDFFIHLCGHLYKEATTLPWIEMKRDMSLYKYCDIYSLLSDMTIKETENLFLRAKELEMEKICAFAVMQTSELFEQKNNTAISISKTILENDKDFIKKVISPKDKKIYIYTQGDILKRFFAQNRKNYLAEVN